MMLLLRLSGLGVLRARRKQPMAVKMIKYITSVFCLHAAGSIYVSIIACCDSDWEID